MGITVDIKKRVNGFSLHDPMAIAYVADPTMFKTEKDKVEVETMGTHTMGMTVVDRLDGAANERNREVWKALVGRVPKTRICWTIDVARWKALLYESLGG